MVPFKLCLAHNLHSALRFLTIAKLLNVFRLLRHLEFPVDLHRADSVNSMDTLSARTAVVNLKEGRPSASKTPRIGCENQLGREYPHLRGIWCAHSTLAHCTLPRVRGRFEAVNAAGRPWSRLFRLGFGTMSRPQQLSINLSKSVILSPGVIRPRVYRFLPLFFELPGYRPIRLPLVFAVLYGRTCLIFARLFLINR